MIKGIFTAAALILTLTSQTASAELLGGSSATIITGGANFEVEYTVTQASRFSPVLLNLRITGVGSVGYVNWSTHWDLSAQGGNTCKNFIDIPDFAIPAYHFRVSACTNGVFYENGRKMVGVVGSIRYRTDVQGLPDGRYMDFVRENFQVLTY